MKTQTIKDRKTLEHLSQSGHRFKYLLFWGHTAKGGQDVGKECLSQWYPAPFVIDGISYPTAEHYMMAEKARLFGDRQAAAEIVQTGAPAAVKKIGRRISGFNEERWVAHRFEIVVRGNMAKFSQNLLLKEFLLSTGNKVLVEASPVDKIWGIGLAQDDPHAENPVLWKGLNLLGFALMEARRILLNSA